MEGNNQPEIQGRVSSSQEWLNADLGKEEGRYTINTGKWISVSTVGEFANGWQQQQERTEPTGVSDTRAVCTHLKAPWHWVFIKRAEVRTREERKSPLMVWTWRTGNSLGHDLWKSSLTGEGTESQERPPQRDKMQSFQVVDWIGPERTLTFQPHLSQT